jgi:hypothetical protein
LPKVTLSSGPFCVEMCLSVVEVSAGKRAVEGTRSTYCGLVHIGTLAERRQECKGIREGLNGGLR